MKRNCWLVLVTMVATSVVAQVNTNTLPATPPPPAPVVTTPVRPESTNVTVPPAKKKVTVKKAPVKKLSEPAAALVPGAATVLPANLNLRGQAGLKGEVVGHLKSGDAVTVVSQINLDKHAPDEPAQWAKILLPSGTKVWVSAQFVDATNKTVTAKKLNLRAGPGENFSVLGNLERGAAVAELSTKDKWIQIETPTNAFAFVGAMYLKQEAPAPSVVATPVPAVVETPVAVPPPTVASVTEPPSVIAPPVAVITPPVDATIAVTNPTTAEMMTNITPVIEDTNPPPPRIVSHEGYVRSSVSVVAPTTYELYDWDTGKSINYLYSPTTNLNLSHYDGFKIIATGEEGITPRWAATPVLTIQKIFVTATSFPEVSKRVSSPRASEQTTRGSKPQQRR